MSAMDENLIREMAGEALDVSSVAADPIEQFRRWYAQAKSAGIPRERRDDARHLRAGRRTRSAHRALQGLKRPRLRRAGLSLFHEL